MEYKLKHEVSFDTDTHSYWPSEEAHKEFENKFLAYQAKGGTQTKKEYYNFQGGRNGKLTSTTQLLSRVFPFNGANDTITKAWLTKIKNKGHINEEALAILINSVDSIRGILDNDMELSQQLGTEAHEFIQEYLEIQTQKKSTPLSFYNKATDNIYAKAFIERNMEIEKNELHELIDNIEELLPCEVPVGYWDKIQEKHLFTGMWDGLYKMKNGDFVIVDIKTGSPLTGDKKLKVAHQMNAYNCLIQNNLGIEPTKHICIEIAQDWNKTKKEWTTNVRLHEFKPKPASFFTMLEAHTKLEEIKGDIN